ncbi:hypothetical protein [Pseudobythopirellula maris]|uniref:hypothetical protein n=1 Tax=Pseudobythopirellula maris TaxID=2527991 RepID=UPI001E516F3D|nr:hypothetical protein [Pseudobythopirellula maris]
MLVSAAVILPARRVLAPVSLVVFVMAMIAVIGFTLLVIVVPVIAVQSDFLFGHRACDSAGFHRHRWELGAGR